MKNLVYNLFLGLVKILSPESRFQFSKRILIDLIHKDGGDSHVRIRRRIYKSLMRNYPINYSYEFGRTYGLFSLISEIKDIEGDIVEFGVGNGKSFFTWASALKYFGIKKAIYGFDSFEGFPIASKEDLGTRVIEVGTKVEGWTHIGGPEYVTNFIAQDESLDRAKSLFEDGIPEIKMIKGYFDKTTDLIPGKIAFLHLDADLYESTIIPLKHCLPRMSKGGIILFDEYHEFDRWPGVKKAVDELCVPIGLIPEYDEQSSRFLIRIK
jgi:hypothetical protein